RSATDVAHLDARACRCLAALFRICIAPRPPDVANGGCNVGVVGTTANDFAQVVAAVRKQAQIQLAFRRKPRPVAVSTKGLADAGDDADFTAAILVAPAFGDLARVASRDGFQRITRTDFVEDFGAGNDF